MRWVERRKGAFGDLERLIVVLEASWKAAKENRLVLGVNIVVWGFNGGPQGPRWPIHGPMPWVRWVERRKGAFCSFERVLLVHTLLKSGYGKRAHFGGKYCCLGVYGPMPRVRWVERNKGAFGSFVRVLLVLTLLESS